MGTVGDRVRQLRADREWTQEDLEQMTGIGKKYISALENGRRKPGHKVMLELCNAFNVSEQEIRYGSLDQNGLDQRHSQVLRMLVEILQPLTETEQLEWLLKIRKEKESRQQE